MVVFRIGVRINRRRARVGPRRHAAGRPLYGVGRRGRGQARGTGGPAAGERGRSALILRRTGRGATGREARNLPGGAPTAALRAPGRRRVRVRVTVPGPCPGRAVVAVRAWGGRGPGARAAARATQALSVGAGRPAPEGYPLCCRTRGRSSVAVPFAILPRVPPLHCRRVAVGRLVQHHGVRHQHVRLLSVIVADAVAAAVRLCLRVPPSHRRTPEPRGPQPPERRRRAGAPGRDQEEATAREAGPLPCLQPALPAAEKYAREAGRSRTTEITAVKTSGA